MGISKTISLNSSVLTYEESMMEELDLQLKSEIALFSSSNIKEWESNLKIINHWGNRRK